MTTALMYHNNLHTNAKKLHHKKSQSYRALPKQELLHARAILMNLKGTETIIYTTKKSW